MDAILSCAGVLANVLVDRDGTFYTDASVETCVVKHFGRYSDVGR